MLKYVDLFSGCGGLSLGLHKSGLKGVFAVEKNIDAFSTLRENLIDASNHFNWPDWLDVRNYDLNDILNKEKLHSLKGDIDLVVGGPPCQGFSLAGKRRKSDKRNNLSELYIEFINTIRPKYILIENVVGYTIPFDKFTQPMSEIIEDKLVKFGYNFKSKIIDMSDFGVPQKRKRYIGFGVLKTSENDFFEILEENRDVFLAEKGIEKHQNVFDAISDLMRIHGTVKLEKYKSFDFGVYGPIESNYQKLMRTNSCLKQPDSHRYVNHTTETTKVFNEILNKVPTGTRLTPNNKYDIDIKKRNMSILNKKEPGWTVTSIPDDYLHFSEPRVLTVREMARLQSFPDDFIFKGKYTTGGKLRGVDVPRYTQVANAVPPLFAEQMGLVIKEMSNNG